MATIRMKRRGRMTEYERGRSAAAADILSALMPMIPDGIKSEMDAVLQLRRAHIALANLYRDAYGKEPPWPANLHLADIIEKYISLDYSAE
jgi:hypothetical protein